MFTINLKNPRLDKGLETRPFALNAFARAYGIALYCDTLFSMHMEDQVAQSRLKAFIGCLVFPNEL